MTYEQYTKARRELAIKINAYVQEQKRTKRNLMKNPVRLDEGDAQQQRNFLCSHYPEFTIRYYREMEEQRHAIQAVSH